MMATTEPAGRRSFSDRITMLAASVARAWAELDVCDPQRHLDFVLLQVREDRNTSTRN